MLSPSAQIWGYNTNFGSFGQFCLAYEHQVLPKAKHLTWEEAAAPDPYAPGEPGTPSFAPAQTPQNGASEWVTPWKDPYLMALSEEGLAVLHLPRVQQVLAYETNVATDPLDLTRTIQSRAFLASLGLRETLEQRGRMRFLCHHIIATNNQGKVVGNTERLQQCLLVTRGCLRFTGASHLPQ